MRRAFTLVEALLALTLTGLLAAGCVTLLMETARARTELETAPLLARHVRGLGGFVENAVRRTLSASNAAGLFSAPPGSPVGTPPALHLRLDGMSELPVTDETRPTGEGWLSHEPEAGLVLLWRTDREAKADANRLTRTVLSPYVTEWATLEYDPARDIWGAYNPARADFIPGIRRRIFVRLKRFGETAELAVPLDSTNANAPAY